MRKFALLTLVLLLPVLISSCLAAGIGGKTSATATPGSNGGELTASPPSTGQPATGGEGELNAYPPPSEYPAIGGDGEPNTYPPPSEYPAPGGDTGSLYPWYNSGALIPWEHVNNLILNGEVSQVSQTHDLKVTITLKDGRTLMANEPEIDAILQVIQTCGDPCKSILIATE